MKTKVYTATRDSVFNACLAAITNLGMSIKSSDNSMGNILVEAPFNIWSWGNEIEIRIESDCWYLFTITVHSISTAQIFSWNMNTDYEENIINEITNILYNHETFHNK